MQELERLLETTRTRVTRVAESQHRAGQYLDHFKIQAEVFTSKAAAASSPELRACYLRIAASHERLAKLAAGVAVTQLKANTAPPRTWLPPRDPMAEAARQQVRVKALVDRLPGDEREVGLAARVEFSDKLCTVSEAIIDQSLPSRNGS